MMAKLLLHTAPATRPSLALRRILLGQPAHLIEPVAARTVRAPHQVRRDRCPLVADLLVLASCTPKCSGYSK